MAFGRPVLVSIILLYSLILPFRTLVCFTFPVQFPQEGAESSFPTISSFDTPCHILLPLDGDLSPVHSVSVDLDVVPQCPAFVGRGMLGAVGRIPLRNAGGSSPPMA